MLQGAHSQWLTGGRLHLQHGPIDVVLKAFGDRETVAAAHEAARTRFSTLLDELVAELTLLRLPMSKDHAVSGPVAGRMATACRPFMDVFVTPMAAVAGAVADELMATMLATAPLARAYVNDGGDIALHVGLGERLNIGMAGDFSPAGLPLVNGSIEIRHGMGIGGLATSGARGRSLSLGIADSVTVLASNAASADVAATLIANAVNTTSPLILREPARSIDPDSDLGERLVTTAVGPISPDDIAAALANGRVTADRYLGQGLIRAAALTLRGRTVVIGDTLHVLEENRT